MHGEIPVYPVCAQLLHFGMVGAALEAVAVFAWNYSRLKCNSYRKKRLPRRNTKSAKKGSAGAGVVGFDRHWRNLGLIRGVETLVLRSAPLFGAGNSL